MAIAIPCSSTFAIVPEMTALTTAARDGRDNTDGVSVLGGRVLFRQIANVLVIHVNIDKAAKFSVIGEKMFTQIGKFGGETAQSFPHGRRFEFGRIALARIGAKRRRDNYFHCHICSPQTAARWRISSASDENSARSSFSRQEVISCGAPFCTLTIM